MWINRKELERINNRLHRLELGQVIETSQLYKDERYHYFGVPPTLSLKEEIRRITEYLRLLSDKLGIVRVVTLPKTTLKVANEIHLYDSSFPNRM